MRLEKRTTHLKIFHEIYFCSVLSFSVKFISQNFFTIIIHKFQTVMICDEKYQFSIKSTFNMNKNRQKFRQIDEIVLMCLQLLEKYFMKLFYSNNLSLFSVSQNFSQKNRESKSVSVIC